MIDAHDPRHGTPAGHHAGCRLTCCREARNRYERNARKRRELGRAGLVDATGSRRRLQALMRLGWPGYMLAEKAGIRRGQSGIDTLIRHSRNVTIERAARIEAVFEELCMTPGPSPITRKRAERNGWHGPLDWDDIDAPDGLARPSDTTEAVDPVVVERILAGDWSLRANRAERLEVAARWSGTLAELERLTSWNVFRDRRQDVA